MIIIKPRKTRNSRKFITTEEIDFRDQISEIRFQISELTMKNMKGMKKKGFQRSDFRKNVFKPRINTNFFDGINGIYKIIF